MTTKHSQLSNLPFDAAIGQRLCARNLVAVIVGIDQRLCARNQLPNDETNKLTIVCFTQCLSKEKKVKNYKRRKSI